ncbi:MAG: type 1 glutamine amidotransferase [Thermodesulfovibrionales bacterium]|nr:type 1 glutamine amidotransferase [Thermodesulfovibrionales bacterium]
MNRVYKPIVGITLDYYKRRYSVEQSYIKSILFCGGLPLFIGPFLVNSTVTAKYLAQEEEFSLSTNSSDYIELIADAIDGLLLSGGDDISPHYYGEKISVPKDKIKITSKLRSEFELRLIKEIIKREKPVFGICLGMQVLNVAFGGSLYQDLSYQTDCFLDHSSSEHYISIIKFPYSPMENTRYLVNSTHHQAVKDLGEGLEVFAISEDGIIEGFYKRDYNFLVGVQWHPERSLDSQLSIVMFSAFIQKAKEIKKRNYGS